MKKVLVLLLIAAMTLMTCASAEDIRVAMITDYCDITDKSFNQTTYEACKTFCEANDLDFTYFKPAGDSDAARVAMIETAIDEDYNIVVLPGYAFADAIKECADVFPEITFVAVDVSADDLGENYVIPENLYSAVYQEELSGYMVGYAAVRLGYTHLGFLGGMAVPAVVRYGYGFVQGANDAAQVDGADVTIEYVYANQFYGDADVTAYMDNWYQNLGVECVFACGATVYTSAAEAAAKVEGGKVIGTDVDQSGIIDGLYGEGLTVTSAMKDLAATVNDVLTEIVNGNFASIGGQIHTLGLVSENPEENYVKISATTQFEDGKFTYEDYQGLVSAMFNGEIVVSNDNTASVADFATAITVNDYGNIK